jgi:hypothetical protein
MVKKIFKVGIVLLLLIASVTIISAAPVTTSTIIPVSTTDIASQKTLNLSQVKVASVYERISDGVSYGRSTSDMINIFKETNTDLIFRGFFRWESVPEFPGASMKGYNRSYVTDKAKIGYTYQQLGDAISQIKAAKPDILFVGAIAAQRLNNIEFNDKTLQSYNQSQTWAMAFDPAKFNITNLNKTMVQCTIGQSLRVINSTARCPQGYDPLTASAYFPDITNEEYQVLLLSYAQKQIDLGADAIWIDMLYTQAGYLTQTTGNPNDPAVKASYDASSKIIDLIHEYGEIKYSKHIYVGTWTTFSGLPYTAPDVDFVTVTLDSQDIKDGFIDNKWNSLKKTINNKVGTVPIYVFIDWNGTAVSPMGVFSQSLTPERQSAWLKSADAFFTGEGMTFVYPVHGGGFPMNSTRLSYGKFPVYDSVSPEFRTYRTIKSLAQNKSES